MYFKCVGCGKFMMKSLIPKPLTLTFKGYCTHSFAAQVTAKYSQVSVQNSLQMENVDTMEIWNTVYQQIQILYCTKNCIHIGGLHKEKQRNNALFAVPKFLLFNFVYHSFPLLTTLYC